MKTWIPSKKIIWSAGLAAVLSILLYAGGFYYVTKRISAVEDFYNNSESQFSMTERIEAIKTAATTNAEYIEQLRSFFVQKGDEVNFIESIERFGRESGVLSEIGSIKNDDSDPNPEIETIEITINAEGPWINVMSFITRLEKADFGVVIQEAKLEEKSAGVWTSVLVVNIFREK